MADDIDHTDLPGPYAETVVELLAAARRASGGEARVTLTMLAQLFQRLDQRCREHGPWSPERAARIDEQPRTPS